MPDAQHVGKPAVFFDGACPLCQREIAFYRRRVADGAIRWIDVAEAGNDRVAAGLSRAAARRRFHVQRPEGDIVSGARAFAVLWQHVPGFRWAGRVAAMPGIVQVLELCYRAFLPMRPYLQRLAGRTCTTRSAEMP